MNQREFIRGVAERLRCDEQRAEGLVFVVFQELRSRLTPKEDSDVAAQLPHGLREMWCEGSTHAGPSRTHRAEFVGRVRQWAGLPDDGEAERAVRAVFKALQTQLGSSSGMEGEAWDVMSVLPKDLKQLWLVAASSHEGS